jgi:hypothetical protein
MSSATLVRRVGLHQIAGSPLGPGVPGYRRRARGRSLRNALCYAVGLVVGAGALPAKDRRLPLSQPAIDMFSSYFSPDKAAGLDAMSHGVAV